MRARRTLVAIGAALTALTITAPAMAGATPPYFDVAKLPEPPVSGKEMADNLEAFSTTYTTRYTGSPSEQNAATMLVDELKSLGYEADIVLQPQAGEPFTLVKAVIATRKGTTHPDEEIVFSTHYDGFPGTVNAAYDNGSGVQMLRALAKSVAQVPTNRTLTFAFYNGEEEGALGSEADGAAVRRREAQGARPCSASTWSASPGRSRRPATRAACACGAARTTRSSTRCSARRLRRPRLPQRRRTSSRSAASTTATPTRLVGPRRLPDDALGGAQEGRRLPGVPQPSDNMATIDAVAGGRSFFEQGMRNTLLTAYYTALAMDNDMPVAKATVTGSGPTVSFDAAGSADPDAAPSATRGASATAPRRPARRSRTPTRSRRLRRDPRGRPTTCGRRSPPAPSSGQGHPGRGRRPAAKKKLSKRARCLKKAKRIKSKRKRAKAVKRCKKRYKKRRRLKSRR